VVVVVVQETTISYGMVAAEVDVVITRATPKEKENQDKDLTVAQTISTLILLT